MGIIRNNSERHMVCNTFTLNKTEHLKVEKIKVEAGNVYIMLNKGIRQIY